LITFAKNTAMAKKQKFYVVWKGVKPGVYRTWNDCKDQITAFEGAQYKSFNSLQEATDAFRENPAKHLYSKKNTTKAASSIMTPSLSVDAACSGNPGVLEYRGVDTSTHKVIFQMGPFPEGTVNLGEFLALVHGLAYMKQQKLDLPIYSDSITAMAWVRNKKIKTTLERNSINAELFKLVDRAVFWINNNTWKNPILKWDTKNWGEIPADYGRK
jgi:ribonuclease HI